MKLTVSKKLSFIISVLVVLILVIGVLSNLNLSLANNQMNGLYKEQLKGVEYIKSAEVDVISMSRARNNLILSTDEAERLEHIESIKSYSNKFEENLSLFDSTLSVEPGIKIASEVAELWRIVKLDEQKIIDMVESGVDTKTIYGQVVENRQVVSTMESKITELVKIKNGLALEAINKSNATFIKSRNFDIAILIICIAIGVAAGIYINRTIVKPIVRISNATSEIADGNLSGELIYVSNKDEIGNLADSFNKMSENLREIIGNVTNASTRVASSSEELFASAQHMTAATQEISTTINELAMGASQQAEEASNNSIIVNQMVTSIERIAQNADNVSEAGVNASKEVQNGIL